MPGPFHFSSISSVFVLPVKILLWAAICKLWTFKLLFLILDFYVTRGWANMHRKLNKWEMEERRNTEDRKKRQGERCKIKYKMPGIEPVGMGRVHIKDYIWICFAEGLNAHCGLGENPFLMVNLYQSTGSLIKAQLTNEDHFQLISLVFKL